MLAHRIHCPDKQIFESIISKNFNILDYIKRLSLQYLKLFAFSITKLLKIIIEAQLREFVLQMNPKVHVFH